MDENAFLERVRAGAGLETTTAAQGATGAVLRTLAEHLAEVAGDAALGTCARSFQGRSSAGERGG